MLVPGAPKRSGKGIKEFDSIGSGVGSKNITRESHENGVHSKLSGHNGESSELLKNADNKSSSFLSGKQKLGHAVNKISRTLAIMSIVKQTQNI